MLQCVEVCGSVLQRVAACAWVSLVCLQPTVSTGVLRCVAARCSVLPRVAARCRVSPRVAACCRVSPRVAACCSVLQRVALRCSMCLGVASVSAPHGLYRGTFAQVGLLPNVPYKPPNELFLKSTEPIIEDSYKPNNAESRLYL